MKNILKYAICALAFSSALSCNDNIMPETNAEGGLTITLVSASHQTKATMDGIEALNENKIETIHYFLYPEDPDNPSADNTAAQPSHWGVLTNVNAQNEKSIALNISEDELNNVVFPRPFDECDVYAIVNLPAGVSIGPGTDKSLANLRNIVVNADFVSSQTQELFVMEGLGKAKLNSRTAVLAAKGEIPVDRVAAKLSVNVKVEESVEFDAKVWKSLPEEMTVEFYNGVSRALLSGDPTGVEPMYFGDPRPSRTFTQNGDKWTCSPFYSYPVAWAVGADEEPYLKIVLPWIYEGTSAGGQQFVKQYTYYKVILGGESMVRNTWYDLTVKLSILGNFNDFEGNDVEITTPIHYYVVDWSTGLTVNTDIMGARYLVVEKTSYELNNQDVLKIPLSTSHDCEIVDFNTLENLNQASVTRPDYSDEDADPAAPVAWDSNWSLQIVTSETEGSYIEFRHKMNNDITVEPYDFAPYTINFRVRHKDEPDNYYRDINIVQNPAMLIEAKQNTDYTDGGGTSNDDGFVIVNNNGTMYGSISGLSGSNSNPNMYIITTTTVDASSTYIIGDPRKIEIDNLNNNNWGSNPSLYTGSTRKLQYYYPTDDNTENIIAPKFRIASSYGKTSSLSFANSERRCASYQEDGYPAGRWRIPTKAELFYIITLTADGLIPVLFNDGGDYWAADGTVYSPHYNNDSVTEENVTSAFVRCVYDEWYWENSIYARLDAEDYDQFTWGDMPRENFE